MQQLIDAIERFRSDLKLADYDEITTKQTVVLQVLSVLGWDIFSANEVTPEYSVESRRVDYSLRLRKRDAVLVEVKKPKEDLETHQNQLLDYAFRQGVELATLTNGMTWWLYLPLKPCDWSDRKFFSGVFMSKILNLLPSAWRSFFRGHVLMTAVLLRQLRSFTRVAGVGL